MKVSRSASASGWKPSNAGARRDVPANAWKSEHDNQADQREHGDDEDAALRSGRSSAQNGFADGVGRQKMVLRHHAAVGDAVEERLRPIPCGVKSDGPPQRTGAPKAETENKSR